MEPTKQDHVIMASPHLPDQGSLMSRRTFILGLAGMLALTMTKAFAEEMEL
jgi:hypothetical protein